MTATKQIAKTLRKELKGVKETGTDYSALQRQRLQEFRKQKTTIARIKRPTNLPRAKNLGYRAKQGIILVRVKIRKGSGKHPRPTAARKPKRMGVKKLTRKKSIKRIAEERTAKKFKNCEVLNSYTVGSDGKNHYYEIILVNTAHPVIKKDKKLAWLRKSKSRQRAFRGLTSAGKKGRGLRKKGKGAEKARLTQKRHKKRLK